MTSGLICMAKLQAIDDSNRSAHYYLTSEDTCYFLHEFTAHKGYAFSPGNQFIFNFKKSPLKRHEAHYRHKLHAITQATSMYQQLFDQWPEVYTESTFVPIPPSKPAGHVEHDDRMWQMVRGICTGREADARELIVQTQPYEAAHLQKEGGERIKPNELQALYRLHPQPPKSIVFLFDDVLSAGCHFRAAKSAILAANPGTQVIGFFLARRVLPNPFDDFENLEV